MATPKRERPRLLSEIGTVQLPVIPTGNWAIDNDCLGVGGFPCGRVSEVYGAESGGKTTLVLQVCAQANKTGRKALFIDAEHSVEPDRAIQLGCDPKLFALYQPDSAEDAIDLLYEEAKSGEYAIIVVDSAAALTPLTELEKGAADVTVGLQARLLSTGLRKVIGAASTTGTCIIFTNQLRCLAEGTLVPSKRGLLPVEEIVVGDEVRGRRGWVSVEETFASGAVPGRTLLTRKDGSLSVSDTHVQHVLRGTSVIQIPASQIRCGDYLLSPRKGIFDECDVIRDPEAELLGMYFADGSYVVSYKGTKVAFTENNEDRRTCVTEALKVTGRHFTVSGPVITMSNYEDYRDFLEVVGRRGPHKKVPLGWIGASASRAASFLRGASFDTHGFQKGKAGFVWTLESEEQAYHVSALLAAFGIWATEHSETSRYLSVTGVDAIRFRDRIGFMEASRAQVTGSWSAVKNARGKGGGVPVAFLEKYNNDPTVAKKRSGVLSTYIPKGLGMSVEVLDATVTIPEEDAELFGTYKFCEVVGVVPTQIRAHDLQVTEGEFHTDRFLTHNSKIGISYGNPNTTPGGNALKFYSSLRVEVTRISTTKEKDVPVSNRVRIKAVKNKLAPPYRQVEVDLVYGLGYDNKSTLFDAAVEAGVIKKAGAWFSWGDKRLGQGRQNAMDAISEADLETIRKAIK